MPYLAQIFIYPVKSLDGMSVSQANILPSGALEGDRTFALMDAQGNFINGKRCAQVHTVRANFSPDGQTVTLWREGETTFPNAHFHLSLEQLQLEWWLSDYFAKPIKIAKNIKTGFPDDPVASGPTVISTATIETVSTWFPGLNPTQVRSRLRTNLELADVPAFWEDQLFAAQSDQVVIFQIGDVLLEGINPCQRCIVPTRDPLSGVSYPEFQKQFAIQRAATLPQWAAPERFNHFYRLAVNTCIPATEIKKTLRVGDSVKILGVRRRSKP